MNMNKIIAFFVFMTIATLFSLEAKTDIIPRKLLFGNPEKAAPHLSPDGTKLAFLAPNANGVLNVWIRDLSHPNQADYVITNDDDQGIRSFMWRYDNQHIVYSQDKNGDENNHLFMTDIRTRKTDEITPFDGVKVQILDYDYRRPDELIILMNRRTPSAFEVYRLDLKTGRAELDTTNDDQIFDWVTDDAGEVRGSLIYAKNGETIVRVRDNAHSPWKELFRMSPEETTGSIPGFTKDNKSIYLIAALDKDKAHLMTIDVKTGVKTLLAEDPAYDISGIMIHPTEHTLEAVVIEREKWDWIVKDPAVAIDFKNLKDANKGAFSIVSRDLKNQRWVVGFRSDVKPTQFYLYDRTKNKLQFLFTTQSKLENYKLSEMNPISFHARDGMKIYGYLTLPQGLTPKNLPTVILVHGGPWVRDSWGLSPEVQWLANRGYAVLQINYRGSTGYGKKYLNAGNREWGGKMQNDLLDGKAWLIEKGYTDPDKVAIYGGSYGGYATLAALAFAPTEFCCGVDIVGPSNLITLLQNFPPYWRNSTAIFDKRVGSIKEDEEFLKLRSPLFKADAIQKPLLIAQGANDPRVTQKESDQIVAAMREHKIPVEYLLFADEGHGFGRPENRLKFYAAAEKFLSKYLGGQYEPAHANEDWEALKK